MAKELVGTSKLGGYLIHVTNEEAMIDADIPTHKVEKGIDISDHVERKAIVVKLSGILIRPTKDRQEILVKKLEEFEVKGKIVTYEGRRIYKNMLISGLNIKANANITNGYEFSLTITEVRIGKPSYVQPKTKAVTDKKEAAGRQQSQNKKDVKTSAKSDKNVTHLTKKGDTYGALARKYGVSVDSLRKLNGYPDRKIPIGVKLKIG